MPAIDTKELFVNICRLDNGYWCVSLHLPGFRGKFRPGFEDKEDADNWAMDMISMYYELRDLGIDN